MHFMLCCIRNHIYNVMSGCMLLSNQINKVLNNIKWIMECGNELIGKHIPHTIGLCTLCHPIWRLYAHENGGLIGGLIGDRSFYGTLTESPCYKLDQGVTVRALSWDVITFGNMKKNGNHSYKKLLRQTWQMEKYTISVC